MEKPRKTTELDAWYLVLEDSGYRNDSPDAWHETLISAADELLRGGVIDWDDCQALKARADLSYERAVDEAVAAKLDDPEE
jgi:hypothetical protein